MLQAHGVSQQRFADMIGVNEKQVRKMLDGRTPIPLATLCVMPVEMTLDFIDRVIEMRGAGPARAATFLRRGIDGLRASGDVRSALSAQRAILDVVEELSAEAK